MIVWLQQNDSSFTAALTRTAEAVGTPLEVLTLDALDMGDHVTVEGDRVTWQGRELSAEDTVVVEALEFLWPQRTSESVPDQADRGRRSLALSALSVLAERGPMIDPPAAGHLAAQPLLVQALLSERGVPVQAWRLDPARPDDGGLWLDPVGDVRGYSSGPPPPRSPAWIHAPFGGAVLSVLVVGGRSIGALVHASGSDWIVRRVDGALPAAELAPDLSAAAEAAARALDVHAAEISLVEESGAVLFARPAPRWSRFEEALGSVVPRALLEHALTLQQAR